MSPSRLARLLLLAALVVAGCGDAQPSVDADGPASAGTAPAPGPVAVAATRGRIGEATTAESGALRRLATGSRPIDPDRVRPPRRREGVGAGASCPDVDVLPSPGTLPAVTAATLCLVNGERADAGLPALTPNARLDEAAAGHSAAMVAQQFFAHVGLAGDTVVDRIRATGYVPSDAAWTVGENLAWGTGELATPRSIVAAWLNSPGHRENVLRPGYREAGQGIVLGNPRSDDGAGATYTMTFGAVEGAVTPVSSPEPDTVAPAVPRASTDSGSPKRKRARATCAQRARRAAARHGGRGRARRAAACRARRAAARQARRAQRAQLAAAARSTTS